MEAVVKQARTTRHPWLVASDANLDAGDFRRGLWFQRGGFVYGSAGSRSIHLSVHWVKGEFIERTCEYLIASKTLQGKISNMEVVGILNQGHTSSYLSSLKRQGASESA